MAIVLASCKSNRVIREITEATKQEIYGGICSFCGGSTSAESSCKIIRAATDEEIEDFKGCQRRYE